MVKRDDRIITSVYLTKEMCSQIDRMADREHISRNEQIRRYIEKGLAVEGYSQDIDLIAGIIRQEVQAVYHIEDIRAVVEQQANRIAKMHMKSGKVDAAAFFLLVKVLMNVAHEGTEEQFDQMLSEAVGGIRPLPTGSPCTCLCACRRKGRGSLFHMGPACSAGL